MTFMDMDRIVRADGWYLKSVKGSHYHYMHPTKPGKVTIPYHKGDLDPRTVDSILKQAGIDKKELKKK